MVVKMILRIYKAGDRSWVSPGALLDAIRADDNVKVVKHHPDAKLKVAITNASIELRRIFRRNKIRAVAVMMWSWVIAGVIAWPPIFYAMSPEARGAVWIGAGVCGLIAFVSFWRLQRKTILLNNYDLDIWDLTVEQGPILLPPVVAWREGG